MRKLFILMIITSVVLSSCSFLAGPSEPSEEPVVIKDRVISLPPQPTVYPGGQSMLPFRYVQVVDMEDLDNARYSIVGEVRGTGCVNAENPEKGDTHHYGKLVAEEFQYTENVATAPTDAYSVALGNAMHELIVSVHEKGAQFVIFPSYTVDFSENGWITVEARALAVQIKADTEPEV